MASIRERSGTWQARVRREGYTPREIVRYQVARVDHALRTELGIVDGLADPQVVVLDPCCGTGAYLVELLAVSTELQELTYTDLLPQRELGCPFTPPRRRQVALLMCSRAPWVLSYSHFCLRRKSLSKCCPTALTYSAPGPERWSRSSTSLSTYSSAVMSARVVTCP